MPSKLKPSRDARPGRVRIIGGRWRRSVLPVPDRPGLRPTSDRVRETLFNWLGQDLAGWRCLDAFAGSGALGFEAASRGAAEVVLIERDPKLCEALRAVQQKLEADAVRVVAADAIAWMGSHRGAAFDLVLLDPPFDAGLFGPSFDAGAALVAPGGWLYLEADRPLPPADIDAAGLALHRHLKAGQVHAHLLRRRQVAA